MIYVLIAAVILLIAGLKFIDIKRSYDNIPIYKWSKGNGEFYFSVPYYIWESNKVSKAKKRYTQNTILEFEGYKYQISDFGGSFPKTNNGVFFEKELRYWGEPLKVVRSDSNPQITINQYGSGNISIDLNNSKYFYDIVNIKEFISRDTNIDGIDKEIMEDFLNRILEGKSMEESRAKKAYDTFLKYEPLLSLAVDIFSVVKDFIIR